MQSSKKRSEKVNDFRQFFGKNWSPEKCFVANKSPSKLKTLKYLFIWKIFELKKCRTFSESVHGARARPELSATRS